MNAPLPDPTLNLYNPQAQSPEQLLAEFIDRRGLLERILDILRHNTADKPQQHVVLIGPRGMGKTTLLCAIRHSVRRDESLNADWLPIQFAEEENRIGDLADFWLEALRHLEQALGRSARAAEELLDENPADLAERAQQRFFEILEGAGRRALLLVDNLNDVFAAIDDGQALHTLRALWMTDPRMTVIGAAPSYFEEITAVDQAFHDFFRTFLLERLNQEELETCLRRYAEILNDDTVVRVIEQAPERVAALRILTGGNPRLVKLGYRVLRDGLDSDLRKDLETLLDQATPFFKHRIDGLAKEARRVFDAIARRWDPVTVDDIRRELRKPSNYVSAQIKRLIDEGFVEEAGGDKKKRYQVSERFYNVYYLWRLSREGRRRLRWLVCFMRAFYSRKDYQEWARRLEDDLASGVSEPVRAEKLAHLHALCAAADDDGGRGEVFDSLVRDAIAHDDPRALDEEAAEGDPVETHGWRYLLAEVVWLFEPPIRKQLGFRPSDQIWLEKLGRSLIQNGLMPKAEARLSGLGFGTFDTFRHALAAGVIWSQLFQRKADAELAYRKALDLNPRSSSAWNNLGNLLLNQDRLVDAEDAYRKALDFDPESAAAWNNLGTCLIRGGRFADAETAYRNAVEFEPLYASGWANLANDLVHQGRFLDAETACRHALELDSESAYAWTNLGVSLEKQHRNVEAESAFRSALGINPLDALAWTGLGHALNGQGRTPEAEVAYRKTLELTPKDASAWNNLGLVFMAQNRHEDAEAAFSRAVELEPKNALFWNNLAVLLAVQGQNSEAETAAREALKLSPRFADFWNTLGNILSNQQRYLKAKAAYRKALELDPKSTATFISLAAIYLADMNRIEDGVSALLRGVSEDPSAPNGHRLLSEHWQRALSSAVVNIAANEPGADNLWTVLTEVLLERAAAGEGAAVRDALLALDETGQAIFEPLLLALQAQGDRSVLYRIAREKRDLVLDVMKRIEGGGSR